MIKFILEHWEQFSVIGLAVSEMLGFTKHGGIISGLIMKLFKSGKNVD